MNLCRPALKLTHDAAWELVRHAAATATAMGVAQIIAVVDEGCNLLALLRMDGSRVLSLASAQHKAMTAAATGQPTGSIAVGKDVMLGLATLGRMTNLEGGLPILIEGQLVGGIGVGSGTSEQDVAVARSALEALGLWPTP